MDKNKMSAVMCMGIFRDNISVETTKPAIVHVKDKDTGKKKKYLIPVLFFGGNSKSIKKVINNALKRIIKESENEK